MPGRPVAIAAVAAWGDAEADDPPLPAGIVWRWDAAREELPQGQTAAPDGGRFVFSVRGRTSRLRRRDARGAALWTHAIGGLQPLDAVLLLEGDTLYAALYRGAASGCRVIALDAQTGALRWDTPLLGVGLVAHSAYGNRVQLALAPAGLVIYGKEWRGRYIEVLRLADGQRIGHRRLPP
jgi:outer membrane protein assembly factor BamB